jgi:glycogen synthase
MKILHLTNYYPPQDVGSYERQCRLIAEELANRGHPTRVLVSNHTSGNPLEPEAHVFRQLPLLPPEESGQRSFSAIHAQEKACQKVLLAHLREFKPDAIIVWGMADLPNSLLWTLERQHAPRIYAVMNHWMADKARSDPWITWWRGHLVGGQRLLRWILRRIKADQRLTRELPVDPPHTLDLSRAFFCSTALKHAYLDRGFPIRNAPVIPCCARMGDIAPRPASNAPFRRLMYVARLDPEKDPLTAIEAMLELRRRGYADFTLDIYGHGSRPYETQLHDFIRKNQLGSMVTMKSASPNQLLQLYASYDALLFTSRAPEPFPLSAIKAMASGLAIISTLEGGSADVFRPADNALIFKAGNPFDLADKIQQLGSDQELANRIAEAGRADARSRYHLSAVTNQVEELLGSSRTPLVPAA